jgi:hypothetical protein
MAQIPPGCSVRFIQRQNLHSHDWRELTAICRGIRELSPYDFSTPEYQFSPDFVLMPPEYSQRWAGKRTSDVVPVFPGGSFVHQEISRFSSYVGTPKLHSEAVAAVRQMPVAWGDERGGTASYGRDRLWTLDDSEGMGLELSQIFAIATPLIIQHRTVEFYWVAYHEHEELPGYTPPHDPNEPPPGYPS